MAEGLRKRLDESTQAAAAAQRLADWFLRRVAEGEEQDRAERWQAAGREVKGLAQWLGSLQAQAAREAADQGYEFASAHGPYHIWMALAARGLDRDASEEDRAHLLWIRGNLAVHAGELDLALSCATEKQDVERSAGNEREAALAAGLIADILYRRGQLDEALHTLREEALPAFERLGDVRSRAVTMGKIADILQARGQLDEALHTLREEALPAFERLGDVRSRAVTMGKIADILQARGQLDEALRIRRQDELPVYERLGDVRELLVGRANLATNLMSRGTTQDLAEARQLLQLALDAAEKMGLPEAEQIEAILRSLQDSA